MKTTFPVFILGSGRSGTLQMVRMLESIVGIEAHHEYLFENILKPAVLYRMQVVTHEKVKQVLASTHVPAVHYSTAPIWVDSSNALPWIIKPLFELFPRARFIHLIRDGRKVASSFFHKFTEIVYDDRCVNIVSDWLAYPETKLEPSPEKKYWRPFPVEGERYFDEFKNFNRFQRLSYYWQDVNLKIRESLEAIPDSQKLFIHLEDMVSDEKALRDFMAMFDIAYDDKYMQILKRPVNVAIPKNFPLTDQQRREFNDIAGSTMRLFGYDSAEEYQVAY